MKISTIYNRSLHSLTNPYESLTNTLQHFQDTNSLLLTNLDINDSEGNLFWMEKQVSSAMDLSRFSLKSKSEKEKYEIHARFYLSKI